MGNEYQPSKAEQTSGAVNVLWGESCWISIPCQQYRTRRAEVSKIGNLYETLVVEALMAGQRH